jgi:hypothetical protein
MTTRRCDAGRRARMAQKVHQWFRSFRSIQSGECGAQCPRLGRPVLAQALGESRIRFPTRRLYEMISASASAWRTRGMTLKCKIIFRICKKYVDSDHIAIHIDGNMQICKIICRICRICKPNFNMQNMQPRFPDETKFSEVSEVTGKVTHLVTVPSSSSTWQARTTSKY